MEEVVCERFFFSASDGVPRSLESGRILADFPLVLFSVSFEHDYLNLVRILLAAGLSPLSCDRDQRIAPSQPLVIGGGVATFMNPEPLAPFVDLFVVGEAEPVLAELVSFLAACLQDQNNASSAGRSELLLEIGRRFAGCYPPALYAPRYNQDGTFAGHDAASGLPARVRRLTVPTCDRAAHSLILTPDAEFADLYLTELGRGCSRGCRFCAAGFIYRPPRLWEAEAVMAALAQRPDWVTRIGLLGMEMVGQESLVHLAGYLLESGCALAFSSLRADRISGALVQILEKSRLKSVAIAPDGGSQRLRRVINKGLSEDDLLAAAEALAAAGLTRLKLYLMVGLPTETTEDLEEMLALIGKIRARMDPLGRRRGRLCELTLSVNSFTPKPWTPFQFHPFGIGEQLNPGETGSGAQAVRTLKGRIRFLQEGLKKEANVRMTSDKPEQVLFQAVLARGDRRLAPVLLEMAATGMNWKQAMKKNGLAPEWYAVRGYGRDEALAWNIIGHGVRQEYLWDEYMKAFAGERTPPCVPAVCRRCGVCRD